MGALWHTDFHHGRLKVLTPGGRWEKPIAPGILDVHSRLGCHLQWHLSETTEDFVHGSSQAIQKRGLPRAFMTDGGGAMIAEEFTEGLQRLEIEYNRRPHRELGCSPVERFAQARDVLRPSPSSAALNSYRLV